MNLQENKIIELRKESISLGAYAAAIYFVCMPLDIVPISGGVSLLKYIAYLVGGLLILDLFLGKTKIKLNMVHFLLGLYVLYSVASLFILRDQQAVVTLRATLQTSLIFFLITSKIYNEREINLFVTSWIVVGIMTTVIMLFGSVVMQNGGGRVTLGIGGGTEDPNQLCGYFILPVLFCLEKINKKDKLLIFYILLIIGMVYVVFTTGSRGGLIAVLVSILIFALFNKNMSLGNKIRNIIIIGLAGLVFYYFLFPLLPTYVTDRLSVNSVVQDQGSGRLELWTILFSVITSSMSGMIFGHGLESTSTFLANSAMHNSVAHNHWIQLWCDQGLIGMVIFFAIFVAGIYNIMKKNTMVAISIFGMLLLSLSLTMYAYYKPFWNILMMSAINFKNYEDGDDNEH